MVDEISIVQSIPEKEWLDFVDNHPDGNIFHTPAMFQVFNRTLRHHPELWAARVNGQLKALLVPVKVNVMGGIASLLSTRAIAYGSILCADDGQRALDELLHTYQRQPFFGPLYTELRHPYDTNKFRPTLQAHHFTYEEHINYLIDLNLPVEEIWKNINDSARQRIKKSQRKNEIEVIDVQNEAQVEACYAMFQKTYNQVHVPLADLSLFKQSFNILNPLGMIKLVLVRHNDVNIAASAALLYKDTIYDWYRGFDRSFAFLSPNDVMVWTILKWGIENGYKIFDFGGAGNPSEAYGPREFKAKFGGRLVQYGRDISIHHPRLLQISQWAYRLSRSFF